MSFDLRGIAGKVARVKLARETSSTASAQSLVPLICADGEPHMVRADVVLQVQNARTEST